MPVQETLYHLLGVPENAAPQVIHHRYRQLVFQYHPDRNGGAVYFEEKLKKINAAYDILADVEKRSRYDRELALARAPVGPQHSAAVPVAETKAAVTDPDADPLWVKPFFRVLAFVLLGALSRECNRSRTPQYNNPEPAYSVADTIGGASWHLPGYDRLDTPLQSMRIDTGLWNRKMPSIEPLEIPLPSGHDSIPLQKAVPVIMDSSGELKF